MIWYKETRDKLSTYRDFMVFTRHSLLELIIDRQDISKWPVLLIQLGGPEVFTISGSVLNYGITVTIWSRHYGW